jgi:hypothetical protein
MLHVIRIMMHRPLGLCIRLLLHVLHVVLDNHSCISATLAKGTNLGAITLKVDASIHLMSAEGWGGNEANTLCIGEGFKHGIPYKNSMEIDTSKPVLRYKCDDVKAKIGECRLIVTAPRSEKYDTAAVLCNNGFCE